MTLIPSALATAVTHAMRMGAFRFTSFGLCAAAGLVLSTAVAARCARFRHLQPEAVWDASLFAVLSCFLASRLLLVSRDPRAFARYPLLVLSLPSLTLGGMAFAAVAVAIYIRRKRISGLSLLDVFAPAGAVLAAFLEFGHWMDGSEKGMPSTLPWAVRDASASAAFRFHPVAMYGVVASLLLAVALGLSLRQTERTGVVTANALISGGIVAFMLDMVAQPAVVTTARWVDPGQWMALLVMTVGTALWSVQSLTAQRSATVARGAEVPSASVMRIEVR